jgi:hypothetical protein
VTTFEHRIEAVEALGFTTRQATFLTLVALHSGYCLRRQFAAFAGVRYGKNVRDFLDSLVTRQLATRFTVRADRGHLYHLQARALYRALRLEHSRNRRQASAAVIARKVMLLDFVLSHAEVEWLATDDDKVDLFTARVGVPRECLPQRTSAAADADHASTTRYFPHRLPIAVADDPPVVHLTWLVTDPTGGGLAAFLQDHASLLRRVPRWCVTAVGTAAALRVADCEAVFARVVASAGVGLSAQLDDLRWYFRTRQWADRGDVARLSLAEIERFRHLRARFSAPAFRVLYDHWVQGGDEALRRQVGHEPGDPFANAGRLVIEPLRFDYTQFGSLPGVA